MKEERDGSNVRRSTLCTGKEISCDRRKWMDTNQASKTAMQRSQWASSSVFNYGNYVGTKFAQSRAAKLEFMDRLDTIIFGTN